MTKNEAKKRIEKLKKTINHHRYLYHVLDKQEISDGALDSLKKELFDLEEQFPDFVTADSPTQRIGGKPLKKFEKVTHQTPMLSFNDAFSQNDMAEWLERLTKLLNSSEVSKIDFYCELKIDGLAIELVYNKGLFKLGSTRGDGKIGENVTKNLKTIQAIPLKIDSQSLVVRGEVFMPKKIFLRYKDDYANPRNLVAGSIRQLDSKITAKRKLDSFAYELVDDSIATHQKKHDILEKLGFKTNSYNKYCPNLEAVYRFFKYIESIRKKIPYEIDGVVVIVNSTQIFNKLGVVGKAPRGAIAYKFPAEEVTTKVLDIRVQVGRTGALTPVAYLGSVNVGGVTVRRATLHNEDEIKRLNIKIGDTVIIERAGDVIPSVVKVIKSLRTGKEKNFKMPKNCPICGSKVEKKEGEVITRCLSKNCLARVKKYFSHFVSHSAFDIDGFGPQIASQLLEAGLVSSPADIFKLKKEDLIDLSKFGEKSAKNLLKSINDKRKISLARFIYSLGIRNVGEETALDLANEFSLDNLSKASVADLEKIGDIGPVVARSIFDWFNDSQNRKYLKKLLSFIVVKKISNKSNKLAGKTFVLTGALDTMTRDDAKKKIRSFSGEISSTISQETSYLVVGESPGSKYKKAKDLGVKIINEKEFLSLL